MSLGVMGATGLVGRHVVELLESDGRHRIVATHHVREPYATAGVSWMKCDLRDPDQAMRALESVESAVLLQVNFPQAQYSVVIRSPPC